MKKYNVEINKYKDCSEAVEAATYFAVAWSTWFVLSLVACAAIAACISTVRPMAAWENRNYAYKKYSEFQYSEFI